MGPPASGPSVGARSRATNGVARHTWRNEPIVEIAEPGREFAFIRSARLGGTIRWRYRFEPGHGGTTVIESYEVIRPVPRVLHLIVRFSGVRDLAAYLRANMATSLERIALIAEGEARDGRKQTAAHAYAHPSGSSRTAGGRSSTSGSR